MKSGYGYVLVHPFIWTFTRSARLRRHPQERLVKHNSDYGEHAGRIVKETGQKWELKTYIAVPDQNWAETVFWGATGLADTPFRQGIEIASMEWKVVQAGLEVSKKAGVRPPRANAGLGLRI